MTRAQFMARVQRVQEYIAAGDIYQVNLSYPWLAKWPQDLDPLEFYQRVRAASPAPYAAYLDLAGTQVFSASPECFLSMQGRKIRTRPIKGTRPRSRDAASDAELREELRASDKERAELVMITDLERNDLGKVCEFGSVRVSELLGLESFAQVHHLVSTVEGTLRHGMDHVEALLACFPGGSISGAPKKRALEIIHELEPHDRGLYTGAIGCFGYHGESHFSIAIRTAWRQGNVLQFHTGAGIVADSVPELEYEETRHKAAGLLKAAAMDRVMGA
jgi:anthranilate/para-aminobenzoate synthase component I